MTFLPKSLVTAFAALLALAFTAPMLRAADDAPLRVAMIGLVHGHSRGLFERLSKRADVKLVGVAEPNDSLWQQHINAYKLDPKLFHKSTDAMLDAAKPDAVVVFTTTLDHLSAVNACAARKLPVMMEKPLAVDYAQARAMADVGKAASIPVLVNFETTWYASNRHAYDLFKSGELGEIRKMVAHDGTPGPVKSPPEFKVWLTDPVTNGGGALMDFGCYGANLMSWIMDGQRPLTVTAVTTSARPEIFPKVEDEATIVVTYPKAQGIIQGSWNWSFPLKDLHVYGTKGTALTVDKDDIRVRTDLKKPEATITAKPVPSPHDDPLTYMKAVTRKQIEPTGPSSIEINLVTMEILDAAKRSAKEGKMIVLEK